MQIDVVKDTLSYCGVAARQHEVINIHQARSLNDTFSRHEKSTSKVKAPRRWYHQVATDLRNMGRKASLMGPSRTRLSTNEHTGDAGMRTNDFLLAMSNKYIGSSVFSSCIWFTLPIYCR